MIYLWQETNPLITDDPQEVYCRERPKLIHLSDPVSRLEFERLKEEVEKLREQMREQMRE